MLNYKFQIGHRRGAVAIWVAASLWALLGFAALCVDMSLFYVTRGQLQIAADAAALAGASQLPDTTAATTMAIEYAEKNMETGTHGNVLASSDVLFGNWDSGTRVFTEQNDPAYVGPLNAIKVTTRRSATNNNPVPFIFGVIYGNTTRDIPAAAIAVNNPDGATGARFIIDDEMIDTDVMNPEDEKVFEDLADRRNLGNHEDVISDLDGDWFIDLYDHCSADGNCIFELPTGQVGDEALFDIDHEAFPFQANSDPSLEDFLNWNEDGTWRQDLIPEEMLDPLVGVTVVDDPSVYPSFVDPDYVHVSPVYKSDTSALDPYENQPAVNAKGFRRGLIAFKILAVGADPRWAVRQQSALSRHRGR